MKNINLVWDNWSNNNAPMPNGLHHKYRADWVSEYKNRYDINVLTRFIPYDRYSLGFFPLLLSQCNITYKNIRPDQVNDNENCEFWYVMEPNHMDISLITENMFGCIDWKSIKLLREKKMKIIFYYAYEAFPFWQVDWMRMLQRSLGWLKIPSSQFVLIFGDLNVGENYQQYIKNHEQYYGYMFENIFVFDHFGWELHDYLKTFVMPNPEQTEILPTTTAIRDHKRSHKFLYLNGGGRPHRKYLLTELQRQGVLKDSLWSYLNKFDIPYVPEDYCFWPVKKFQQDTRFLEMIEYHNKHGNNIQEKHLDVNAEQDAWHNRGMTADHYKETYFNVVSETWPADPSFFITEKIFKPIINLQPFIVCGLPGVLKYLKEKGYETWGDWFTEDYDSIKGTKQRMYAVSQEITRVASMPPEKLHNRYVTAWEKLLHNRNHFFKFDHTKGFKELIEGVIRLT